MANHSQPYDVATLARCNVFILDLDGTVYEETGHFTYYGEQLAGRLPAQVRTAYLKDVTDALAGKHALHYGVGYDVVNRAIVKDGKLFDWSGHPLDKDPSSQVEYVDDPWNIYGNMAAYHGVSGDDIQESFRATREHMESDMFPMTGMEGLRGSIDRLKTLGVRFALATNSPEPDSRTILGKLGLTGAFEIEVFNAKKQLNAKSHFERFQRTFDVPFEQMVSVGDHFRNEIRPAIELGMKTICIDRYHQPERQGVTVIVQHPTELAKVFSAVADARA